MNKPVAWMLNGKLHEFDPSDWANDEYPDDDVIPLYTHPVKEQSNLANVVKNHIEDLVRCVKLFRSYEMDNTADEMEVAIKELEDAIEAHPVKELTDDVEAAITKFLVKEMPKGTIIGNPKWWAKKIAREVLRKVGEK